MLIIQYFDIENRLAGGKVDIDWRYRSAATPVSGPISYLMAPYATYYIAKPVWTTISKRMDNKMFKNNLVKIIVSFILFIIFLYLIKIIPNYIPKNIFLPIYINMLFNFFMFGYLYIKLIYTLNIKIFVNILIYIIACIIFISSTHSNLSIIVVFTAIGFIIIEYFTLFNILIIINLYFNMEFKKLKSTTAILVLILFVLMPFLM